MLLYVTVYLLLHYFVGPNTDPQGRLFQSVDHTWRENMKKTFDDPSVLSVARRAGFLEALVDANDKLDTIQKGLNDYLETKRLVG